MEASTPYALCIVLLALVVGFLLLQPTGLVKWLQKKNYQYEVTFSLYMLTPTEKFVFNSVLFLTFSMFVIACTVYLPNHIVTMFRRSYYYFVGGDAALLSTSRQAAESLYGSATRAKDAVLDAATEWAQSAYLVAKHRTPMTAMESVEGLVTGQ